MRKNNSDIQNSQNKVKELLAQGEKKRAALRFEKGLFDLEKKNYVILENKEFLQLFKLHLCDASPHELKEKFTPIFEHLCELVLQKVKDRIVFNFLDSLAAEALNGKKISLMILLSDCFTKMYGTRKKYDYTSNTICNFLVEASIIFARSNHLSKFNQNLQTLYLNRNQKYITPDGSDFPFRNKIEKVSTKDILERNFQYYKTIEDSEKDDVLRNFVILGDASIMFLLNRLIHSREKTERAILIHLISSFGDKIIQSVKKLMEEDLPWYALRNLITLIADTKNHINYPVVEGYLVHPDIRVQNEVVQCISKLGGKYEAKRLVEALPVVDDDLKQKIILRCGTFRDEKTGNMLIDQVNNQDIMRGIVRDDLLHNIFVTLKHFPYFSITKKLENILENGNSTLKKHSDVIEDTIQILNPQIRHRMKETDGEEESTVFDFDPENEEGATEKVKQFIESLEKVSSLGTEDETITLVINEIRKQARAKQFKIAELLRDRLLEINPDSLQDVLQISEEIEAEKSNPIIVETDDKWSELMSRFSEKDREKITRCFRNERYSKGESIVNAGDIDPCLYFLNSGFLQLSYQFQGKDVFLKKLNPGEIAGIGPFFSSSVWTVSLSVMEECDIQVLHRDVFKEEFDDFEKIESVLEKYCRNALEISKLVKMSGNDRREYARYKINIIVNNILLDDYGQRVGKRIFQGEMMDISRGGLAFTIKLNKRKNADLLLGRKIISEINLKGKEILKCYGRIVSIHYLHNLLKEYSVHVKFDNDLEQYNVTDVLNLII